MYDPFIRSVKQNEVARWFQSGLRILLLPLLALQSIYISASGRPALVEIGESKIEVFLPNGRLEVSNAELLDWVRASAGAVTTYYGRFPIKNLTVRINSRAGSGIWHGATNASHGALIRIWVGRGTRLPELQSDWMLPHEMVHLAFPSMPDQQHWIEEGIATYVESIARAQSGQIEPETVWEGFVGNMPFGEPQAGDHGLDYTTTWGRTYWGGALFCLVADVRIRRRTNNRYGLQDSLRAIAQQSGGILADWGIKQALEVGDEATGTDVLMNLYRQWRDRPVVIDLDRLWRELGVSYVNGNVEFRDNAEAAHIRVGMFLPPGSERRTLRQETTVIKGGDIHHVRTTSQARRARLRRQ